MSGLWQREPARIVAAVAALLALLVKFGVPLKPEQVTAILEFMAVLLPLVVGEIVRSQVSPAPKPPGSDGDKPVHVSFPPKSSKPPSNVVPFSRHIAPLVAVSLVLLCMTGCAGSLEAAKREGVAQRESGAPAAATSPDRCASLDSRRAWFGASAKGFGLLAGGSGITSITTDDKDTRIALAVGAAVAGAGAAVFAYMTEQTDESFVRECSSQ